MRFTSVLWTIFLVLGSMALPAQENTSHDERYDQYHSDLSAQFKEENWWYRTWNRYEVNPGFSQYAIGPAYTLPTSGWEKAYNPFALRYRRKHLEIGAAFWKGQLKNETDTNRFQRYSAGYFTPVGLFRVGKRHLDVKGFLLQPVLGIGYTNTNRKHGAYVSPGIHLQLPFVVLAARSTVEYTLGGGINVFPEISLQLDALRSLLDPSLVKTGEYNHQFTSATPLGGGWYQVTTTSSSNAFQIKDIGPLWGITPRVGKAFSAWVDQPYTTYGLGITGRINYLGADIHMGIGKVTTGVVPNANALDATVKNKFDNTKVAGTVNTREITFEGNVNIVGLFLSVLKKNAIRDMGMTTTPLNRFSFHLGVTHFSPGKANFLNSDSASAYTDNFFSQHPEVERNSINDPLQQESEWGVTYGLSLELGAVGLRVNNKLTKTIGKSSTVEVYYILPISKIIRAYR